MKTRQRILVTSLNLFNHFGEPNVTTVDIANEMEISPGNLYYHYRNKHDIVNELFDRFEGCMQEVLDASELQLLDLEDSWLFLQVIFENIWNYRFIYRDLNNILSKDKLLRKRFNRVTDRKYLTAKAFLDAYTAHELIRVSDQELQDLLDNVVLTTTYWINFASIRRDHIDEDAIRDAVYQVMQLVYPYLDQEHRRLLRTIGSTIANTRS